MSAIAYSITKEMGDDTSNPKWTPLSLVPWAISSLWNQNKRRLALERLKPCVCVNFFSFGWLLRKRALARGSLGTVMDRVDAFNGDKCSSCSIDGSLVALSHCTTKLIKSSLLRQPGQLCNAPNQ